ncbi:hypothetical protein KKA03_01850 [archaeon]|nr:hypothetical protein [archaeon]
MAQGSCFTEWGQDGPNEYYLGFSIAEEYIAASNSLFGTNNYLVFFESDAGAKAEFDFSVESAVIFGYDVSTADVGEEAIIIKAENGARLIFKQKNVISVLALNGVLKEGDLEELISLGEIVDETIKGA